MAQEASHGCHELEQHLDAGGGVTLDLTRRWKLYLMYTINSGAYIRPELLMP